MEASNEKLDNQRDRKTSVLVKDFVQVVAESPVSRAMWRQGVGNVVGLVLGVMESGVEDA